MTKASVAYEAGLMEDLKNPEEAAAYLSAAMEEGTQEAFLLALRDVASAHGIAQMAQESMLNRENLYRLLSESGNPRLSSLVALLNGLGLKLVVEVKRTAAA